MVGLEKTYSPDPDPRSFGCLFWKQGDLSKCPCHCKLKKNSGRSITVLICSIGIIMCLNKHLWKPLSGKPKLERWIWRYISINQVEGHHWVLTVSFDTKKEFDRARKKRKLDMMQWKAVAVPFALWRTVSLASFSVWNHRPLWARYRRLIHACTWRQLYLRFLKRKIENPSTVEYLGFF